MVRDLPKVHGYGLLPVDHVMMRNLSWVLDLLKKLHLAEVLNIAEALNLPEVFGRH